MMQGEKLRRADFVTSLFFLGFGIWMLTETFKMPMRDTFGGVQNVWYVSPALFPLIISCGILLLGAVLLVHAIRAGGGASFLKAMKNLAATDREPLVRFGAILLGLLAYVYLYIPRVDFFLATALVLYFSITAFYLDDHALLKQMTGYFAAGCAAFVLIFATPAATALNRGFAYLTDVIALAFFISMVLFVRVATRGNEDHRAKMRAAILVTLLTPLILVPLFRYFLRVQMPREGGIIEIMHLIYYSLR